MEKLTKIFPENFPPLLKEIPDSPELLYLFGSLPDPTENTYLCVVGSRKYSSYGKEVCEKLIDGLRGYPIVIVSGLALGIDGIAHQAALNANLKTIAVPGSGLNPSVLYPASHQTLAQRIVAGGGALLSEFEPNFRATPYSFPQRNRIMAGLSKAVLVIEAEKRSGTLITARLALDYNRDVLTVPGSIFSKTSEGPHYLIQNGATPVTNSQEILIALGFSVDNQNHTRTLPLDDCSVEEKRVLECLAEPLSRDELIQKIALPAHAVNAIISMLEIKGLVVESGGAVHRT